MYYNNPIVFLYTISFKSKRKTCKNSSKILPTPMTFRRPRPFLFKACSTCWMSSNRLQLNANKTEMLWCATTRRQSQLPTSPFRVCNDYVTPSTAVRDLGIYFPGRWCQHAVSGLTDCLTLFRHFETTYYTAFSVTVCLSVSCCGVGADEAWLWKHYAGQ